MKHYYGDRRVDPESVVRFGGEPASRDFGAGHLEVYRGKEAILSSEGAYYTFIVCNTSVFLLSIITMVTLTQGFSLRADVMEFAHHMGHCVFLLLAIDYSLQNPHAISHSLVVRRTHDLHTLPL